VGEWYRFADGDGDGDLDVFAEAPLSLIRYYRNDGTPAAASFTLAADTLKDVAEQPIFADRQNIPALADLHCTGRLGLFLGTLAGRLVYYAHAGLDGRGVPRFRREDDFYQGIEIVGDFGKRSPAGASRHGANAITFTDLDRDGDLDLFWGDFFSPSLYVIENTGTCAEPQLERIADVFPPTEPLMTSGYNVATFGDLDADGDQDLLVGVLGGAFSSTQNAADNLYFFENEGAEGFALRTQRYVSSIDVGEESIPAAADLDADGTLDLVLGNKIDPADPRSAALYRFTNEGSSTAPVLRLTDVAYLDLDPEIRYSYAPAFADVDADGDLDLFVGLWTGAVAFFRNEGTSEAPVFTRVDEAYVQIDGSQAAPAFADIDADGDLDLFVGEAFGTLNFFRNEGRAAAPAFSLVSEVYQDLRPGNRSVPAFWDAEADGDLDLFVGTQAQGLVFYRNEGTPQEAAYVQDAAALPEVPAFAAPAFVDLDGDGDADLLLGGEGGGLVYLENEQRGTSIELPTDQRAGVLQEVHVYPNPSRGRTTFAFTLRRPARVRLAVYDLLGRRVAVVFDAARPGGRGTVTLDAGRLHSGVYVYRFRIDGVPAAAGRLLMVR
jgi:hypothetical protein